MKIEEPKDLHEAALGNFRSTSERVGFIDGARWMLSEANKQLEANVVWRGRICHLRY